MDDRAPAFATLFVAFAMLLIVGVSAQQRPSALSDHAASEPITFRIDPNTADRDTLCLLPEIGPGLAQRVVDDRQANGPFDDAQDMQRVKMVGEKTAAAVSPWVTFAGDRK